MASITSSNSNTVSSYNPKAICQIVGYTCLVGFAIDMLVLALPPDIRNVQWRIGMLQQIADRGIILLFGLALIIFGLSNRRWLKQFSRLSLLVGILFFLVCPLVIADAVKLQQQAVNAITTQASQFRTQIDNARANPSAAGENVTPEALERASQQLTEQTDTLTKNARTTGIKAGVAIVGNLVVVGLGLVSLGRYAMRSRNR
jgi:hypothetical protein